ncbi:SDR family oxidoreductase [Amycolatopsis sp. NPDC049253]|uniref:SDR family NAD(P)-dependent oxidoreductase n=1 Tax=Amycolatopsis sp. NPDC049253 TaxID=3155274 RepID=UPI0034370CB4
MAIVTGSGRGIGRAIAEALSRAGAAVAVLGRSEATVTTTARLIRSAGGRAMAVTADVTEAAAVADAVAKVRGEWGEIDLLVNNAGCNTAFGRLWETDAEAWWSDVTVNLRGPVVCSAAVLPGMVRAGCGRIVNIVSSTAGEPFPHNSSYAAAKAGLVRLTDSLAAETAGHGIAVFALDPGSVDTRMHHDIRSSPEGSRWLGGLLKTLTYSPASLAGEAAVYLASGRADALSGRWFVATDDFVELTRRADEITREDFLQLRRTEPPAFGGGQAGLPHDHLH